MKTKTLTISSGRGPAECMWVVDKVLKEVIKDCKKRKIEAKIIKISEGNFNQTLISATILIQGQRVEDFVKDWRGSIQWIGKSPFRKYHKRKNWFIEIFEKDSDDDVKLNLNEVQFKATKSSGPGGQHTNKTSSAVRASHTKSGLSVLVQDSRSQHQNKKIAIQRLQEIFAEQQFNNRKTGEQENWKKEIIVQRGNPTKTFSGQHFKECQ